MHDVESLKKSMFYGMYRIDGIRKHIEMEVIK
jgi:hypothetical protein